MAKNPRTKKAMTNKKVDISFACNQKWSAMDHIKTDVKHCNECKKNINDYSNTKKDLVPESNLCGRFDLSQIGKIQKTINLLKTSYYAASIVSIFGISVLSTSISAQEIQVKNEQIQASVKSVIISGTIRNPYDNSRVPFVLVQVMLDNTLIKETKSTFKGTFEIEVDTLGLNFNDLQLVFSANEFEIDTVLTKTVSKTLLNRGLNIELESIYDCFKAQPIELGVTGKIKQAEDIIMAPPLPPEY